VWWHRRRNTIRSETRRRPCAGVVECKCRAPAQPSCSEMRSDRREIAVVSSYACDTHFVRLDLIDGGIFVGSPSTRVRARIVRGRTRGAQRLLIDPLKPRRDCHIRMNQRIFEWRNSKPSLHARACCYIIRPKAVRHDYYISIE